MSVKIFFCYAHEDEVLLNKLKTHLKPLQRQGLIDVWHDRDIKAGTEWEQEISKHLNGAEIILLLLSPDFMDSDYCYSIEMKQSLDRHKRGETRVIPIILRHVYWQGVLGKLQALPTDAKPVLDRYWYNNDEAYFNIAEGIRATIEELTKPKVPTPSKEITQATKANTSTQNKASSRNKTHKCSFCGESASEVFHMVAAPDGALICDECIDICMELIAEARSKTKE